MTDKNAPHTIRRTRTDDGRSRDITYPHRRAAEMFTGMSLLDNGYVKSKAEAQRLARRVMVEPVTVAGVTFELVG